MRCFSREGNVSVENNIFGGGIVKSANSFLDYTGKYNGRRTMV